ncbi:DUF5667 domain-containing protein [Streptomyces desertarenae]|uniref:DUF5667 domain-containing protein n=1 Tax=Streptomyces desertarenae TaxID=2666184 RepID=A0ABW4PPX2_9ACTN
MMGAVSPSRRANAFAQALDEHGPEGAATDRSGDSAVPVAPVVPEARDGRDGAPGEADGQGELLSLADRLASLPRPTLAPDVRAAQRAMLVAAVENGAVEGTRVPEQRSRRTGAHRAAPLGPLGRLRPRTRLTKGLAAGGLSVGVAAGAFTGAAVASTDALPGDTLYGLKLGMEDLSLDMADGDADRGRVLLDHASTRLNETRRLLERGRAGDLDHESLGDIRRTLSLMREDVSEGHRLLSQAYEREGAIDPMRSLSAFSRTHGAVWDKVRADLPVQLSDVRDQVSSAFAAIEDDVTPLRSLLEPEPEEGTESPGGGTGGGRTEDGRTVRPSSPAGNGQDAREGGRGGSGAPSPSGSGSGTSEEPGVLPSPGDLLNPPQEDGSPSAPDGGGPRLPEPDVTIPPILPDILPGLGIDTGGGTDDRR